MVVSSRRLCRRELRLRYCGVSYRAQGRKFHAAVPTGGMRIGVPYCAIVDEIGRCRWYGAKIVELEEVGARRCVDRGARPRPRRVD